MSQIFFQAPRRMWIIIVGCLMVAAWVACGGIEVQVATPEAVPPQPAAPTATPVQAPPVGEEEQPAEPEEETPEEGTVPQGQPPSQPSDPGGAEWTVMLYQDADDEILEQDIMLDFNEAELIGSTEQVNLVAQVDRYRGA
jgi:hypothetical protein